MIIKEKKNCVKEKLDCYFKKKNCLIKRHFARGNNEQIAQICLQAFKNS